VSEGATPPEPTPRATLYRSAATAIVLQWSVRLIGLVSVFILARLLTPEDFGILGLAVAALSLVELLGAVGLRQALLRIREPERDHYDTAWTIQLILFSAMALAGLAAAPLVAFFYGQPAVGAVMAVLSGRFLLIGLINVGIIDFEREMQFGKDLRMRVGARLAAFAATVAAALLLRNYWALVVGLMAQSAFVTLASYLVHPYRPRLSLRRRAELLGTSLWIFVNAVTQAVQLQIEKLVLGRFTGPALVGLYSVSKDLSEIFTQEIATALNRVTFVTVARSGAPLSEAPLRTARILGAYAMIAAPMGFGLAATAENSIYAAFFAVYKVISSALQASGHARRAAFMSGGGALCLASLVAGAAWLRPEPMTVAYAAFAANLLVLLAGIVVIARSSAQSALGLAFHVLRPFGAAGGMMAAVQALGPETDMTLVNLLGEVAVGAIAYPLFLYLLWRIAGRPAGGEQEAFAVAAELRGRLLRRPAPVGEA
jgi:lipopolysaccharide exporter